MNNKLSGNLVKYLTEDFGRRRVINLEKEIGRIHSRLRKMDIAEIHHESQFLLPVLYHIVQESSGLLDLIFQCAKLYGFICMKVGITDYRVDRSAFGNASEMWTLVLFTVVICRNCPLETIIKLICLLSTAFRAWFYAMLTRFALEDTRLLSQTMRQKYIVIYLPSMTHLLCALRPKSKVACLKFVSKILFHLNIKKRLRLYLCKTSLHW